MQVASAHSINGRGALSVDDFLTWSGIGRSKFYHEVNAGKIKVRKVGRKSVVTAADALAWLDALPVAKMTEAA